MVDEKYIFYLVFVILVNVLIYARYLKKKREELVFLEVGVNHILLFNKNTKTHIYNLNIKREKIVECISNLASIGYEPPKIDYWYWINEEGEKVGTSFLIREDENNVYQYEMTYMEFLKIENEILKITGIENFEEAVKYYFQENSKNITLVSIQFEDLLVKKDVQYEKIIGK